MKQQQSQNWRGLSRDEIRREYDMRVAVADGQSYVQRYLERSEVTRSKLTFSSDLRYGPLPRQMLDVFPVSGGNAPVVMFWHGGAWRYQSKEFFSYIAEP